MSETTETGTPGGAPGEKPGRYQRSTGGLIGSMIVLVLVVLGIVVFRATFRDTPQYEPTPVDYRQMIVSVQELGLSPVYPPALPDGWSTKTASFDDARQPSVDMAFTTADGHTVGIHQADVPERDLLTTYVGEGASQNGDTLTTPLGTWTGWKDTDADHAWTTQIGDDTVLVYSSGDPAELTTFVQSLTTAKLEP